jgi:hypothetical protein
LFLKAFLLLIEKNMPRRKTKMNLIACSCGHEILLVPDLQAMCMAIEKHVLKSKCRDSTGVANANKARDYLIAQILQKASEAKLKTNVIF